VNTLQLPSPKPLLLFSATQADFYCSPEQPSPDLGFIASDILSSPRILFALSRDGILPRILTHVHPRFRTPDVAIGIYAFLAFLLSLTSTFESLAIMANVAALFLYAICCAAAWELMRRDVRTESKPLFFPGARLVPIISIVLIVWILTHATVREFKQAAAVFTFGTTIYLAQGAIRTYRAETGSLRHILWSAALPLAILYYFACSRGGSHRY
jgi:amino acid transporter